MYGVGGNSTSPERSFFSLDRKERTKEKIKTDGKNDCTFPRVAKTNHIRWTVMDFRSLRFVFDATLEMFLSSFVP